MYLAEAVTEMEFIQDSISKIQNRIESLMVVKDKLDFESVQALLKEKFTELGELYKKYQQFGVTIERAKSNSVIQVNNSKLSLADAMTIKNVMLDKLETFEAISSEAERINKGDKGIMCLDLEEVYKEVESVRVDIKTLAGEIDFALWQVEV